MRPGVRTRLSLFVCPLALASVLLCVSSPALADDARAREAFARGIELYDHQNFREALEAFEAAYAEKPSAAILQNIGLCHEALGDDVHAATAFDEALAAGDGKSPKTREAIEAKLRGLATRVATITFAVVDDAGAPVPGATVAWKPSGGMETVLDARASLRPIRLRPGVYTFRASAPGFAAPPDKRLALVAGAPVEATFEVTQTAQITLRPNVAGAELRIDGRTVGKGPWSGKLTPGTHRVEASAAGFAPTKVDVVASVGAVVDYPITLRRTNEPPEYAPPPIVAKPPPPPYKRWYVAAFGALDGATLRLSGVLERDLDGHRRSVTGGSFGLHGGFRFSRWFSAELHADMGFSNARYDRGGGDTIETETHVDHWQMVPMLRFATPGKVRLTTGAGPGVQHLSLDSRVSENAGTRDVRGSGTAFAWLLDIGMAVDVGPIFLEGAFMGSVVDTKPVRDEQGRRLLLDSPATRIGFRLGVGIAF